MCPPVLRTSGQLTELTVPQATPSLSLKLGICPNVRLYDQLNPELTFGKQQVAFVSKSGARQTLECSQFLESLKHKACFGRSMSTEKTATKTPKPNKQPSNDTGTLVSPGLGG